MVSIYIYIHFFHDDIIIKHFIIVKSLLEDVHTMVTLTLRS
jgi:hypothetical protein